MESLKSIVSNWKVIFSFYVILTLFSSLQSLNGTKVYKGSTLVYNKYNNYTIFEKSFEHLRDGKDLYKSYPEEHWDLYKYTPSFSVFFGLFSSLPDWLGLSLWNLLNALFLLLAIYSLPKLTDYQKGAVSIFLTIELLTSIQNEQSNGLMAGLFILAFALLEKEKVFFATLCILFSVFIKLFGVVGFALFLFYPHKFKAITYSLFWTVVLLLLPLIFIDLEQYTSLFKSYFQLLGEDHTASYGYSIMGIIHSWFSVEVNKNLVIGVGAILFLIPLVRSKLYTNLRFRFLLLSSVLLWVVIFNHKAESPTFIIAMAGAALWFVKSKKSAWQWVLIIIAFILTSLSVTDLFPRFIRDEWIKPLCLKAVPCVLIWGAVIWEMLLLEANEVDFDSK